MKPDSAASSVLLLAVIALAATIAESSDVYWKRWDGTIPEDAVVGASNIKNNRECVPTYLAQAYINFKEAVLQPVEIFADSKTVFASYNMIHETSGPIKVLCSQNPGSLEWFDYSSVSHTDPDKDFVIAGYENGYNLYFGRTSHLGRTIIGKVVIKDNLMYFPDGDHEGNWHKFEILGYKN